MTHYLINSRSCPRDRQERLLKEEGFTIIECGADNRLLRVENYKEYLFDFEDELTVDFASLQKLRKLRILPTANTKLRKVDDNKD